jgi:hypothetical protein
MGYIESVRETSFTQKAAANDWWKFRNPIKQDELFTDEFIKLLQQLKTSIMSSKGEVSREFKGLTIYYNPEFNIIRVGFKDSDIPFNVQLDPQGNIKEINFFKGRDYFVDAFMKLRQNGVIRESFDLSRVGISENDLKVYKQNLERLQRAEHFISEKNDPLWHSKLPSPNNLSTESTRVIGQREALIITNPKKEDAIYTFGAGPCSVVVAIERNPISGNVQKIGLAHVDALTDPYSVNAFLYSFTNPEVYLISGDRTTVMNFLPLMLANGIAPVKIDLDTTGERSDAVAIDGNGNIYWGDNYSLNEKLKVTPLGTLIIPGRLLIKHEKHDVK